MTAPLGFTLNWREIGLLAAQIAPELEGRFLDRVGVPERARFPEGYLKGEWALRFSDRRGERTLLISLRNRHPYFCLASKSPAAAKGATQTALSLALSKHLKGARLQKVRAPERERALTLEFANELTLFLGLIPNSPEAVIYETKTGAILYRGKASTASTLQDGERFELPDGSRAPTAPATRAELIASWETALRSSLDHEAFSLRKKNLESAIKERAKHARERLAQSETARDEALKEPDYGARGDLLKPHVARLPEQAGRSSLEVEDFATGETVALPVDPKLTPRENLAKLYALAKRKSRRTNEAAARAETFAEALRDSESALARTSTLDPAHPNWDLLEREERLANLGASDPVAPAKKDKTSAWPGKSFTSRDGWAIWVGRNKIENLDLTFKHARGNDVWLHARGKPGAHAVIPVPSGKSVPLETLLDAATLVLHYSGGGDWGKTEVDYTFKKHVKRIKDSSEASYTHNKTLLVAPDTTRLARLLGPSEKNR